MTEPSPPPAVVRGPLPATAERLDGLVRDASRRHPDRVAVRGDSGAVTFGELDRLVSRCAGALTRLAGGPGAVIGLTAALDPACAVAYYGIARGGCTVALVNPLLGDDELIRALRAAGPRVLVAPERVAGRLRDLAGRLAGRPVVVTLHQGLSALMAREEGAAEQVPPPAERACIQFTSGTTGEPKAIVLSHRNLCVNAAQTAQAHGLDGTSVTLNHLPNYHPMHLNSAMCAGAEQVLCTSPDSADAIALANRHRATHYYSLPVRLARLAADPGLGGLALDTVRAVYSGGSALPVAAAEKLSGHFGIPVVQGYGLAETSPLVHCDLPQRSRPGSVGVVVAQTECRVVDVTTRAELGAGEVGEVLVRGPQVMTGYLDGPGPVDADGWFATGDVGRVDEEGYLFLVDRLKDVFKHGNWLVSPTEIERVLLTHPQVADAVVVDGPDEFAGSVAHAYVVVRGDVSCASVRDHVNERVAPFQRLRTVTAVAAIPRTATGKIRRREIRDGLLGRPNPRNPSISSTREETAP
ncbi:class I adenylate-forming enzyme family protein [Streptomyces sp. NPDC001388]|uniref:class I adenylate-forming enzyme family protein n=1 Tax=Streptomyces sp. NPDC001388 TaxID=3364568 RepID=UPI0036750E00